MQNMEITEKKNKDDDFREPHWFRVSTFIKSDTGILSPEQLHFEKNMLARQLRHSVTLYKLGYIDYAIQEESLKSKIFRVVGLDNLEIVVSSELNKFSPYYEQIWDGGNLQSKPQLYPWPTVNVDVIAGEDIIGYWFKGYMENRLKSSYLEELSYEEHVLSVVNINYTTLPIELKLRTDIVNMDSKLTFLGKAVLLSKGWDDIAVKFIQRIESGGVFLISECEFNPEVFNEKYKWVVLIVEEGK